MSDSYSAWCDAQAEKREKFSEEKFEEAKKTAKFRKAAQKASGLFGKTKVYEAKRCENCAYCVFACFPDGNFDVRSCSRLGIRGVDKDWTCGEWKKRFRYAALPKAGIEFDPDVAAYGIVNGK